MNYYLNCCSLTKNGDCDCESCIYYGGMDHGVVRCKADESGKIGIVKNAEKVVRNHKKAKKA